MPLPGLVWMVAAMLLATGGPDGAISPRGRALARALDHTGVEHLWLPDQPVDWRTGRRDPEAPVLRSHCSAFVAGVCAAFQVDILRPPEHGEKLLANAQCRWLDKEGAAHGWQALQDGSQAQCRADQGELVVACYRNPENDEAGHIAIVRPGAKSRPKLLAEGPDVIQAGRVNYRRVSVRLAFSNHPLAWEHNRILYYAHLIPRPSPVYVAKAP
jgi:hypothetical protein